jgi:hypothetical protein
MKKLKLNVEALRVESFSANAGTEAHGTVHGQSIVEPSGYTYCIPCGGGGDTDYECASHTCGNSACCAVTPNTHCEM